MNLRTLALMLVLAVLLTGSALPSRAAEQTTTPSAHAANDVIAGGGYRIVVQSAPPAEVMVRRVIGVAVGGSYQLHPEADIDAASTTTPASSEAGCCCVYMPCVMR